MSALQPIQHALNHNGGDHDVWDDLSAWEKRMKGVKVTSTVTQREYNLADFDLWRAHVIKRHGKPFLICDFVSPQGVLDFFVVEETVWVRIQPGQLVAKRLELTAGNANAA